MLLEIPRGLGTQVQMERGKEKQEEEKMSIT